MSENACWRWVCRGFAPREVAIRGPSGGDGSRSRTWRNRCCRGARTSLPRIPFCTGPPLPTQWRYEYFRSASIGISLFHDHDKICRRTAQADDIAPVPGEGCRAQCHPFFDDAMTALDERAALEASSAGVLLARDDPLIIRPAAGRYRILPDRCRGVAPLAAAAERAGPARAISSPLAEETGLIARSAFALDQACAELGRHERTRGQPGWYQSQCRARVPPTRLW